MLLCYVCYLITTKLVCVHPKQVEKPNYVV